MFKKALFSFCLLASMITTASFAFASEVMAYTGVCGSDNGKILSSAPVNLCVEGTPSPVFGSGPWNWYCDGLYSEDTAECSADSTASKEVVVSLADKIKIDELINSTTYGEISSDVKEMQDKLKEFGFFPSDVDSTGYYGQTTLDAVNKYKSSTIVTDVASSTVNKTLNEFNRAELLNIILNLLKNLNK